MPSQAPIPLERMAMPYAAYRDWHGHPGAPFHSPPPSASGSFLAAMQRTVARKDRRNASRSGSGEGLLKDMLDSNDTERQL